MKREYNQDHEPEQRDKLPIKGNPIVLEPKTGRNSRCHCGSGKKFKKCCIHKPQHKKEKPKEPALDLRKGQYLGLCNLSSCKTLEPATWYNHGSYKYYCKSCAYKLANDPVNKQAAYELFGHELCTEGEHKP